MRMMGSLQGEEWEGVLYTKNGAGQSGDGWSIMSPSKPQLSLVTSSRHCPPLPSNLSQELPTPTEMVCPTRKTSTFIFLQIPNLSFCTVSITVKFIDSHTTKLREFVLPLTALFTSSPPLTKGSLNLRMAYVSGVYTVSEDGRELGTKAEDSGKREICL